jgi:peptide methionine sulfoxide reductase MsrB
MERLNYYFTRFWWPCYRRYMGYGAIDGCWRRCRACLHDEDRRKHITQCGWPSYEHVVQNEKEMFPLDAIIASVMAVIIVWLWLQ